MMSDTVIKVENVTKAFSLQSQGKEAGGNAYFEALRDISFDIKRGETVGIIGKNGSGKSTLLRILSGLTKPSKGRVTVKGKVASILEIGTGFHSDLTGRENIYFSGQLLGFSRKEIAARLQEIVAFSGIEKFIDEPVKNYSSGMYLRLAFSIIVHIQADILLLDEVMSVGDAEFQVKCSQKLLEMRKQAKGWLLVSHNMNDVMRTCDKVIRMEEGKIISIGKPQDEITEYMESSYFAKPTVTDGQAEGEDYNVKLPQPLPDTEMLKITGALVNGIQPESAGEVFVEDELVLELNVTLKKSNLPYAFGLTVRDLSGNYISSMYSGITLNKEQAGDFYLKASLPANLFNATPFLIDLVLFDWNTPNDSITFQPMLYVKFSDRLEADSVIKGLYRGYFRPHSKWTMQALKNV